MDQQATTHPSPKAAERLIDVIDGGDFFDADDAMGETDCPDGCYVEPDGSCPHGFESAGITLGVI